MMITAVAFAICLTVCVRIWWSLRKVKKHDDVLFPFCQLRRDVMRYRYESLMADAWSREESESLRRLSHVLDATIHNYNDHKTVMFNLRTMVKYMNKYRDTAKKIAPLESTNNPKIQAFHHRFGHLAAKAFIAYTPLIRWELLLRLIAQAYRLGYAAGKTAAAGKAAAEVIKNAEQVRDDERRYAEIASDAVTA